MMRDVWGGGGGWFKESLGRKIQNSILVLVGWIGFQNLFLSISVADPQIFSLLYKVN